MTKPILKWPGGKQWLARKIAPLIEDEFETYIEPFLGAGALFFELKPQKAIISDINQELIQCYRAIKTDGAQVLSELNRLKPNRDEYYRIRDNWHSENSYKKAARLIYLLRHSWNGLYRVNQKGKFNVPYNSRIRKHKIKEEYMKVVESILSHAKILNCDFEETVNLAKKKDLIFADPPYFGNGNEGFCKYNKITFTDKDQKRLSKSLKSAEKRDVLWILTNGCRNKVKNYYSNYEIFIVPRMQVIAANSKYRKMINEYLVLSKSNKMEKLRQHLRASFELLY